MRIRLVGVASRRENFDLDPEHTDTAQHQPQIGRFKHHDRVGDRAIFGNRAQRAIAGALLFDHRDKSQAALGEQVGLYVTQCTKSEHADGKSALHVTGAAAVHPSIAAHRLEWRGRPKMRRFSGHDIHVPIQKQQQVAISRRRSDDLVAALGELLHSGGHASARVIQRTIGERQPLDRQPEGGGFAGEHFHCRLFEPDHAWDAHKRLEKSERSLRVSVYRSIQLPHAPRR